MSLNKFNKIWEHQQGALFLKEEHNSLEWKKKLAEYFYEQGLESVQEEVDNIKKILAKELSENDKLGAEYVLINILKEEIKKLRLIEQKQLEAYMVLVDALKKYSHEQDHGFTAREALAKMQEIFK